MSNTNASVKLTNRELLYISAFLGAVEFYGLPDGFFGMDESEINCEILNIQNSLLEKKYADMDFNGKFEVSPEILGIVRVCVQCEKYITFDAVSNNKEAKRVAYYFNKDDVVEILQLDNVYKVSKTKEPTISKSIFSAIKWIDNDTKRKAKIQLSHELLAKVKEFDEFSNPVMELSQNGCPPEWANVIYKALTGKANYYAVVIVNFEASETDVMSLMVINSKDGSLELVPVIEDKKDVVEFRPIDFETMQKKITDTLFKIGIASEEVFA